MAVIENREKSRIERVVEEIVWKPDRALLNDVVFRLQLAKDESWDLGDQCVVLYKGNFMVNKYRDLFRRNPQLQVENMLELGIFEGGSIALWRELLAPKKMSAVDLTPSLLRRSLASFRYAANASGFERPFCSGNTCGGRLGYGSGNRM